jgi:hypothetical protein
MKHKHRLPTTIPTLYDGEHPPIVGSHRLHYQAQFSVPDFPFPQEATSRVTGALGNAESNRFARSSEKL